MHRSNDENARSLNRLSAFEAPLLVMGKRLDQLWVVGVVLLISFIGFTSQIWVVFPAGRYRFSDPELLRVLLPFNALLVGVFGNYALTVRTDPGRVPKGWVRHECPGSSPPPGSSTRGFGRNIALIP